MNLNFKFYENNTRIRHKVKTKSFFPLGMPKFSLLRPLFWEKGDESLFFNLTPQMVTYQFVNYKNTHYNALNVSSN